MRVGDWRLENGWKELEGTNSEEYWIYTFETILKGKLKRKLKIRFCLLGKRRKIIKLNCLEIMMMMIFGQTGNIQQKTLNVFNIPEIVAKRYSTMNIRNKIRISGFQKQ